MTEAHPLSKREFLHALAALSSAALLPMRGGAAPPAPWVPGLQLYTLGTMQAKDLDGVLRQVAAIGYRAVELAYTYECSAAQLRAAFDKAGLVCSSIHVLTRPNAGWWDLESDPGRLADDVRTLGADFVVMSGPWLSAEDTQKFLTALKASASDVSRPYSPFSAADWRRTADFLNEKATLLARSGLRFAYHNHAPEFVALPGGGTGFDIVAGHTDPALVDFELDVGWVAAAGRDPLELLSMLGKRLKLVHLKDVKHPSVNVSRMAPADVGTGIVDWGKLVPAIRRAGIKHLFVEQEPPFTGSRMEAIRVAYAFLSAAFARAE